MPESFKCNYTAVLTTISKGYHFVISRYANNFHELARRPRSPSPLNHQSTWAFCPTPRQPPSAQPTPLGARFRLRLRTRALPTRPPVRPPARPELWRRLPEA